MELADSVQRAEVMERGEGKDHAPRLRELAAWLDWDRIYFDLLDYKAVAELPNVAFTPSVLRDIVANGSYTIHSGDQQFAVTQFKQLHRVEELALTLLRKYIVRLHDHKRRAWEQQNLRLQELTAADNNLSFESYSVRTRSALAKTLRDLVQQANELYHRDLHLPPTIHFDRHLYQPLLAFDQQKRFESAPPLLNEGETRLVRDLRAFFQNNEDTRDGKEVFLLRNRSRGHGIGFFTPKDGEAFYPDFILWVIQDGAQTVAFIDPHGLGRARGMSDPKIQLHRRLADLQPSLQAHCSGWRVRLTSFVVSPTPFDEMRRSSWIADHTREELEAEHVLFQEPDAQYIRLLWDELVNRG